MATFTTINGSCYELDIPTRRVRRLSGTADPTPRQAADGTWQTWVYAMPVHSRDGYAVFFDWTGCGNGTTTSEIEESDPPAEEIIQLLRTALIAQLQRPFGS